MTSTRTVTRTVTRGSAPPLTAEQEAGLRRAIAEREDQLLAEMFDRFHCGGVEPEVPPAVEAVLDRLFESMSDLQQMELAPKRRKPWPFIALASPVYQRSGPGFPLTAV